MKAEITLLSHLVQSIQQTSRPVPTRLRATFSKPVLPGAHNRRQDQTDVSSVPTSLLPFTMLALSAMAPDCTPAGKDRGNNRTLTKEGENGKKEREAPKGAGPLLLAAATQPGLRLARQSEGRKELSASQTRLSGQAAQSSGGTGFTATQALTGARERELHWTGKPEVAVQGTAASGSARAKSRPVLLRDETQPPSRGSTAGL